MRHVQKIKDLFHKHVSDVQILIPVLNRISKKEVYARLPKLIHSKAIEVRRVFRRLLGLHGQEKLTPVELMVVLHRSEEEVEAQAILNAWNICFRKKLVFTKFVLVIWMDPLPNLLVVTVIWSMITYPELYGFIMGYMEGLITKKVWKNEVLWELFIVLQKNEAWLISGPVEIAFTPVDRSHQSFPRSTHH